MEVTDFYKSLEQDTVHKSYFGPDDYSKPFDGQTGTTALPVWNIFQGITFDGSSTINSDQDVAQIMRVLESKQVELAFAVHIDEHRKPFIQFLSCGTRVGTFISPQLVLAGAKLHNSKQIYLVHNHPSGTLKPSQADLDITKKITLGLKPLGIDLKHIIINTYKKQYTLIADQDYESYAREEGLYDQSVTHTAHIFDAMDILDKPLLDSISIKSSQDVVKTIQQLRFSALPKHGILALNNRLNIIGNFFIKDFSLKTVTDVIGPMPTVTSVIAYGNTDQEKQMRILQKELNPFDFRLLDYVQLNSNEQGVTDAYKSYSEESILREIQKKYGTASLTIKSKKELNSNKNSKEINNTNPIKRGIKF